MEFREVFGLIGEAVQAAVCLGVVDVEGPGVGVVVVFLGVAGAGLKDDFDGGGGRRGWAGGGRHG